MNPTTRAGAEAKRYGGYPGRIFKPDQCAFGVYRGINTFVAEQCSRKPGYGPDGLYCKQHARKVSGECG